MLLISYYLQSFAEGVLTFISPCILPMLPIYFIYLAGDSEESEKGTSKKKGNLALNSIGFVTGFTIIFVLLGATATTLGSFFKEHRDILKIVSGIVVFIFGLNFTGLVRIGVLNKQKGFEFNFKRLNFLKSIIFGMVFSVAWSPCVGAFLSSALAKASVSDTIMEGMLLLLIYSIGLGIPFIISAIAFDSMKGLFKTVQRHSRLVSIISGSLLIIAGLAFIFNFI
ncbi:cytochrome c biogenesis protein CcdA [Acetivibrio clariflavus]|uniref:cytochrome c biogenesis protein CcdA n=1 Tax=Acetivibrio clariflavus TaxID=288965 RepID=UPI000317EACC